MAAPVLASRAALMADLSRTLESFDVSSRAAARNGLCGDGNCAYHAVMGGKSKNVAAAAMLHADVHQPVANWCLCDGRPGFALGAPASALELAQGKGDAKLLNLVERMAAGGLASGAGGAEAATAMRVVRPPGGVCRTRGPLAGRSLDEDAGDDGDDDGAASALFGVHRDALTSFLSPARTGAAILFPGQGTQHVGMLLDTVAEVPEAAAMVEVASELLGRDILELCREGPAELLARVDVCQPLIYTASLCGLARLRRDRPAVAAKPLVVGGLSLGELTAMTAAGCWDFETGLRVVLVRAAAMQRCVVDGGDGVQVMATVAGLPEDLVEKECEAASAERGVPVAVANYLFPSGVAVSGDERAVSLVEERCRTAGALKVARLHTRGAFHTAFMRNAETDMSVVLEAVRSKMRPSECFVVFGKDAKVMPPGTSVDAIIDNLTTQPSSPVRWAQSMKILASCEAVSEVYEVGPLKQLKAMMKRIDDSVARVMQNVEV